MKFVRESWRNLSFIKKVFNNHFPIIAAGGLRIADANERYPKPFDGIAIGVNCTSAQKGTLTKLNDISVINRESTI